MQVIVDTDYLELLEQDNKPKQDNTEYNPFTGKRCQMVSIEEVKKLVSLPKEERQTLINKLKTNYSKR